ncbi:MAG: penicillin acylase family protein [Methylococcales bacterium]
MQAALPKPVFEFLTPGLDFYTEKVLGGTDSVTSPPLPEQELIALLEEGNGNGSLSYEPDSPHGSNGWVVEPNRTRDGRAILANDMHLDLGVPNIWYRAELHYGDVHLAGITLPGVPLVISGSNGHIAWGFTGSGIDVLDLVAVETNQQDPSQYRTAQGWRPFDVREEVIRVKGAADKTLTIRGTVWGPVLSMPLFNEPFAVRWIALDAEATDLKLMNLDRVTTVQDALDLFNQAGGPVLNALVADAQGDIGWTLTGRIPVRFGLDGSVSESWADGTRGWRGYMEPREVPRQLNPPEGFIVNANQKMVGVDYPIVPANYAAPGYRAFRIQERLLEMRGIREKNMLALQLDTWAEAYRHYQGLAIKALNKDAETAEIAELKRYIEAWDGRAEPESLGLALLVEFRRALLEEVLFPFLSRCRELDPQFEYRWIYPDVPLQRLLDARIPELLPDRQYGDSDSLVREILVREARRLMNVYQVDRLDVLSWGLTDRERIAHPLSGAIPFLSYLLDMPKQPLPGCPYCVRAARGGGATERLVVSPGHEKDGLFHMPGGQSGHPLSPYYGDQHGAWVQGLATSFLAGKAIHKVVLMPSSITSSQP